MGLEVCFELAGCYNQSEGELLHWRIPFLCTMKCLVGVVHELLNLVFFFDKDRTNSCWGDSQIEEKLFPRL